MEKNIHPGRYILSEIEYLNVSVRQLAKALDVAPSTIQRVITGKSDISPAMAVRLEKVIGSTSNMWLRLQDLYSLELAKNKIDLSKLTPLDEVKFTTV